MRVKKEKKAEASVVREVGEALTMLLDAATPANPELADGEKKFQFTKRAHYRVMNSYHTKRLWEMFKGQSEVDLPAVEYAILSFEQERGPVAKELKADAATACSLTVCRFQMSEPCIRLDHEFLPRTWISKQGQGKLTGSYTSIDGQLVAACEPCKKAYNEYAKKNGEPMPYYTSRAEVEAYLERQHSRGELKQSLLNQMEKIRAGMRKQTSERR